MLHMICTQLHPGQVTVRIGDSSRHSEAIVKNLELCFSVRLLLLLQPSMFSVWVTTPLTHGPYVLLSEHMGLSFYGASYPPAEPVMGDTEHFNKDDLTKVYPTLSGVGTLLVWCGTTSWSRLT